MVEDVNQGLIDTQPDLGNRTLTDNKMQFNTCQDNKTDMLDVVI